MSVVLVIAAFAAGLAAAVAKGILGKEIQGQIEQRVTRSVELTIASLPAGLQDDWADEWRAELASQLITPISAMRFARGLRATARELAPGVLALHGARQHLLRLCLRRTGGGAYYVIVIGRAVIALDVATLLAILVTGSVGSVMPVLCAVASVATACYQRISVLTERALKNPSREVVDLLRG